jgi:DNA-binding NarL/FixJ family response regulator
MTDAGANAGIQVLLVEDHPPVLQGLELLLRHQGFRIAGSARCAAEGASMIRARRPDVAVVDIDLGDGSGTDLAKAVAVDGLRTAVVLYTGSINSAVIDEAVAGGARGLVLKTSPVEHLADAIRAAAVGRVYLDTSIMSLPGRLRGRSARCTSTREAQVLRLLARGRTTQQVADELFISPDTVQTHVRNATRKLGAHGRLHAVMLALGRGEIELPESS